MPHAGGIHVFKTAQADSVISHDIGALAPHGFKFTEGFGAEGNKYRYRLQNGKVVEERIENFTARYRIASGQYEALDDHFAKTVDKLIDETNGDVISNLVSFWVHPGWLDRRVMYALGGSEHWICGDEPPPGHTGKLDMDD